MASPLPPPEDTKTPSPPPSYAESSAEPSFAIVAPPSTMQPSYADQPFFAPLSSPPLLPNAALYPTNSPATHTSPLFGPTPISQQQGMLLPYYDARSPYSIEQAGSRTKWRFLGALFWAFVILAILVTIFTGEIWAGSRRWWRY